LRFETFWADTNEDVFGHSEYKVYNQIVASELYIFPKAKAPVCNCFRTMTNNSFGTTSVANQQLLTDFPAMLTRFSVQYRPSRKIQNRSENLLLLVEWPTAGVFGRGKEVRKSTPTGSVFHLLCQCCGVIFILIK